MFGTFHSARVTIAGMILIAFSFLLAMSTIQRPIALAKDQVPGTEGKCIVSTSATSCLVFRCEERIRTDHQFSLPCVDFNGAESDVTVSTRIRFANQGLVCSSIKPIRLTLLSTAIASSSL